MQQVMSRINETHHVSNAKRAIGLKHDSGL